LARYEAFRRSNRLNREIEPEVGGFIECGARRINLTKQRETSNPRTPHPRITRSLLQRTFSPFDSLIVTTGPKVSQGDSLAETPPISRIESDAPLQVFDSFVVAVIEAETVAYPVVCLSVAN
jgi:hypothetical protein